MTTTRRFLGAPLWAAVCLGFGCTAEFPPGVIVCSSPSDCPTGMTCHVEDDTSKSRCFPGERSDERDGMIDLHAPDAATTARDAAPPDAALERNELEAGAPMGRGGSGGHASTAGSGGAPQAGAGDASDDDPQAGAGGTPTQPQAGSGGKHAEPQAGSGGEPGEEPEAGSGGAAMPAAGSGGSPEPPAPCDDPTRECDVAEIATAEGACGLCDTGSRTHTRNCNSTSCRWQAWSAWSECTDPAQCTPAATESRSVSCPGCGAKTQTRECSAQTCTFQARTDASSCSWCDACGELVFCDTPDNVATNRGTWCRPHNGCSNDQAWGRCLEILKQEGCNLHEPYYIGN